MRKINYSKFDLEGFTLKELQRICRYYGIEYFPSWSKTKLRKEILSYSPIELVEKTYNMQDIYNTIMYSEFPIVETKPIKSVRVQRIEELKGK